MSRWSNSVVLLRNYGAYLVLAVIALAKLKIGLEYLGYVNEAGVAFGRAPVGVAYGFGDNYAYLSFVREAFRGDFMFSNLLSTEPHGAYTINFMWSFIGHLAALAGIQPITIYMPLGIIAGVVLAVIVYFAGVELGLNKNFGVVGAYLAVFGGGVTFFLFEQFGNMGRGVDFYYFDLFPYANSIMYPYHAMSYAVIALLIVVLLKVENSENSLWVILAPVVALILAYSRPYESPVIFGAWTLHLVTSWLTRSPALKRIVLVWLGLAFAVLPATAYYYWVSTQPVWSNIGRKSFNIAPARIDWIMGFGLLLLFTVPAIYARIKGRRSNFLVWWLLMVCGAFFVLNLPGSKAAGGVIFPMALLSAEGMSVVYDFFIRRGASALRWSVVAVFCSFLWFTAYDMYGLKPYVRMQIPTMEGGFRKTIDTVSELYGDTLEPVLTYVDVGIFVPALAGFQVYSGHWSLTNEYDKKNSRLLEAGVNYLDPDSKINEASFRELMKENGMRRALLKEHHFQSIVAPVNILVRENGWVFFEFQ